MGVLWVKAPFVLRRHRALLAAVVACSAFAALAAAATPILRAGVESESLRGELVSMSPLAAGLDVDVLAAGPIARDRSRRSTARKLAAPVPFVGAPVVSSRLPVQVASGPAAAAPIAGGAPAAADAPTVAGGAPVGAGWYLQLS